MDKNVSQKNIWKFVGYGLFAVIIAAILCVRFMYGSVIAVSGMSMYPTFNDTDYVFATILHEDDELSVGDIVIVEEDGVYVIKRIAAMPGDTLQPDYVKGIPELTMGEDEYYILGDNWSVSRDSRMFGPVSRDKIAFKYADIHWTRIGMFVSLLIPAVLFIAQLSIVFIPADKKKQKKLDSNEQPDSINDNTQTENPADNITEPVQENESTAQPDITNDIVQTEQTVVD